MKKPWIERRKVAEAIDILARADEDWEGLDGEERHGPVVQAWQLLTEVRDGDSS